MKFENVAGAILVTVIIVTFMLGGCAHQPPGGDLWLMVK